MDFGNLLLPRSPAQVPSGFWAEVTVNRILVVVAVVLSIFALRDFFSLWPLLSGCLVRSRGNVEIEHSVSQARNRNRCAAVGVFILCLLSDRYSLYNADFLKAIPSWWRVAFQVGVAAAFLLLRQFVYVLIDTITRTKMDSENRIAAHRALYNYFLAALPLLLATVAIMWMFHLPDSSVRWALLTELAVALTIALIREGQILRSKHSGLQTFLYLCGLELIPVAALVLSAMFL